MYRLTTYLLVAVLGIGMLAACGQEDPPKVPTTEELQEMWRQLARAGTAQQNVIQANRISNHLAVKGADALQPMLDMLGSPDEAPSAKVMAFISLAPHLRPEFLPQLIAFSQPGQDTTTRACTASLLGMMTLPEAEARTAELAKDPERRVRMAALLVQIRRNVPEAVAQIDALWHDPDGSPEERQEMVLAIPEILIKDHLDILQEAVVLHDIEPGARQRAAGSLGRLAGPEAIPALEQCARNDPVPQLQTIAQEAIDAIRARNEP